MKNMILFLFYDLILHMKISLNYDWQFVDNYANDYLDHFPKSFKVVDIPHCIQKIPSNNFLDSAYRTITTYRKIFDVEESIDKNKLVFLDFDGYMVSADIYLNKNRLGRFYSFSRKVRIDVTKFIKKKDNELIVVLDSNEDLRYPPYGDQMKFLVFGGIHKKVSLNIVPKIYIDKSLVNASVEGRISIKDIVKGNTDEKYTIKHEIFKGHELIAFSSISAFILDFPELWSLNNPRLYTLRTTVYSRYGEDTFESRFGFRDIRVDFDGIYINNELQKLVGINRLESYPYVGFAMPKSGQENDAELIKFKLGFDIVRCVGFPPNEDFLNKCDEIGLLVITEPPSSVYVSGSDFWRNEHIENVRTKTLEEYNHPCIIANSVRIDGAREDRELFEESHLVAKEIDPYRPTFGAINRYNATVVTDMFGYDDYSSRNMNEGLKNMFFLLRMMQTSKPILISDYVGQYDFCKITDDPTIKSKHALHHLRVLNDVFKHTNLVSSFASSFSDYYVPYALSSGDNIFYSGVVDLNRSKKPAAEAYYSQQDYKPMIKVLSALKPFGSLNHNLGSIVVLTNGDYIELYKDDVFVKRFYPGLEGFNDLKHPPVVIDDLLGQSLNDQRFDKKENLILARLFSKIAIKGYKELTPFENLKLFSLGRKYHITPNGMKHLYNRYIGPSVIEQSKFVFRVYKNDEWVASETFAPPKTFDLSLDIQKTTLVNGDTFDVSRIHIKYVDQNKHVIETLNTGVKVSLEGPISLLSESEFISMKAGQCSIWVRSHKKFGKAKVIIELENIKKEIDFKIVNKL